MAIVVHKLTRAFTKVSDGNCYVEASGDIDVGIGVSAPTGELYFTPANFHELNIGFDDEPIWLRAASTQHKDSVTAKVREYS